MYYYDQTEPFQTEKVCKSEMYLQCLGIKNLTFNTKGYTMV